jgi:hypothetical protein
MPPGWRPTPVFLAGDVVDAGVQARLRQRQPRLGQRWRHHQHALVVDLGARQQQVHRALQPAVMRRPHAVGMRALDGQPGTRHEGHQHQRSAEEETGPDRVAGRHPSVKR